MSLDDWVPQPACRSLMIAKTRSGKSTFAAVLIERYAQLYPHRIYIVDPKRRYFPVKRKSNTRYLFPDGFSSRIIGRRKGIRVYGKVIAPAMGWNHDEQVFIVQDEAKVHEMFGHLFRHSDANHPVLVFLDETFDVMGANHYADRALRRLIQMGGEQGIGLFMINQRPRGIDRIFLTESEYIYLGRIQHIEDRLYLRKNSDLPPELFDKPLPKYSWILADQQNETFYRTNLVLE